MKRLRTALVLVVGFAVVFGLWTVTAQAVPGQVYTLATAKTGAISQTYATVGTAARVNSVELSFEVDGTVTDLPIQLGSEVKAGDVLAKVGSAELKLAVLDAEAELADAEASLYSVEHPSSASGGSGMPSGGNGMATGGSTTPSKDTSESGSSSGGSGEQNTALNPAEDDLRQLYAAIAEVMRASAAWSTADDPEAQPTLCDQIYTVLKSELESETQPEPEPEPGETPTPSESEEPTVDPNSTQTVSPSPIPSDLPTPTKDPTKAPEPSQNPEPEGENTALETTETKAAETKNAKAETESAETGIEPAKTGVDPANVETSAAAATKDTTATTLSKVIALSVLKPSATTTTAELSATTLASTSEEIATPDDITVDQLQQCGVARKELAMANAVLADYYNQLLTTGTIEGEADGEGSGLPDQIPDTTTTPTITPTNSSSKGSGNFGSSGSSSSFRNSGNSSSAAQIAQAESAVLQAEQKLDEAKADLAKATLIAPVSGTVGALSLVKGAAASGSVTIVSAGAVEISFELPLAERQYVSIGDEVAVKPVGRSEGFTGTLTQISPLETSGTAGDNPTYTAIIAVEDPDMIIPDASNANVELNIRAAENVVMVPVSAVTMTGLNAGTVKVAESETAAQVGQVEVKLGAEGDGWVEITEGLATGQLVVLSDSSQPLPEN